MVPPGPTQLDASGQLLYWAPDFSIFNHRIAEFVVLNVVFGATKKNKIENIHPEEKKTKIQLQKKYGFVFHNVI